MRHALRRKRTVNAKGRNPGGVSDPALQKSVARLGYGAPMSKTSTRPTPVPPFTPASNAV